MPDGNGATGAGTYPALASDQNLATAGYPITVVLHGLRGMPPVGYFMSDDQVAAVVNYVRTHFGNNYPDAVNAGDVKAVRK
jgi:mono/diheme cytochrome c family protein